jgi:hypothetical protein
MPAILNTAGKPLGLYDADSGARSARLDKAGAAELSTYGLTAETCRQLVAQYPRPGQLRAVAIGEVPPFVVRRPSADEQEAAAKQSRQFHSATTDLLLACVVWPAPLAERRSMLERWPGLGASLFPLLVGMRNGAVVAEKKDKLSAGPPRGI